MRGTVDNSGRGKRSFGRLPKKLPRSDLPYRKKKGQLSMLRVCVPLMNDVPEQWIGISTSLRGKVQLQAGLTQTLKTRSAAAREKARPCTCSLCPDTSRDRSLTLGSKTSAFALRPGCGFQSPKAILPEREERSQTVHFVLEPSGTFALRL